MTKYNPRAIPLTQKQLNILLGVPGWRLNDVPPNQWSALPGGFPGPQTVAVMASGDLTAAQILNGQLAVGGVDWIRHETRPKADEPEGNAYHFVILQQSDGTFAIRGPYCEETWVTHWLTADDLNVYR